MIASDKFVHLSALWMIKPASESLEIKRYKLYIVLLVNHYIFSGDFIMAAQHFGVAHPPGYPLYVTAGYVWMKLMPFGNPAFKLNVLTSFIGGLAAFVVYLTTYKLVHFC